MTEAALAVHRAFYDAVETGDVDLMASLWADDPEVSCIHPGATPLRGTAAVLRSWTVLMANVGYIQFFLTEVELTGFPRGSEDPSTVAITCTENILSGSVPSAEETFTGGKAICTSILIRDASGWKFWSRHASPVADLGVTDPEES
jgi:ketosteroid isomerase-like protein